VFLVPSALPFPFLSRVYFYFGNPLPRPPLSVRPYVDLIRTPSTVISLFRTRRRKVVGGVIIHFLSLCLSTCVCRVLLLCSILVFFSFFSNVVVVVLFCFRLPFFYSSLRHVALYDQRPKQKSKRRRRATFYLFYFKETTTRFRLLGSSSSSFSFFYVSLFISFLVIFLFCRRKDALLVLSIVLRCCSPRASSERTDGRTSERTAIRHST